MWACSACKRNVVAIVRKRGGNSVPAVFGSESAA